MADEVDKNPPGDAGGGGQDTLKDAGQMDEPPTAHPRVPDRATDTSTDDPSWKIGDTIRSLQLDQAKIGESLRLLQTGQAKIMSDRFEELHRTTSQAMSTFQTGEQAGAQLRETLKNCQLRWLGVSNLDGAQPHETTDSGSKELEGTGTADKKYNDLLRDFTALSSGLDAKFKERSDELDAKFKERSDDLDAKFKQQSSNSDAEFGKLTGRLATTEKQLAGTEHRSIEVVGLLSSIVALVLVSATTANSQTNPFSAYLVILVAAAGLMVFACLLHAFFQPDARRSFPTYWLPFAVAPTVFILGAGLLLFLQSLKH